MTVSARHLVGRILRNSWQFPLIVLAALVLGKAAESLLDEKHVKELALLQAEALKAVNAFDPFAIAERFWCAVQPRPPAALDQWRDDCAYADAGASADRPLAALSPTARATLERQLGLGAPSPLIQYAAPRTRGEPNIGHWAYMLPVQLAPAAALADVTWHLAAQGSTWRSVVALLQFAVGAAVVLVLGWREEKGFWFYVLGLPILTVLAACAAGFATQWVMILGLLLFGGITSLAGMCCGSAGMAYAGYFLAIKVTEIVVHEKITERIRRTHD